MRPFGAVLPFDQALAVMRRAARVVEGQESVPLASALARVLAMDVPAPFDVPGFDRSAMDGYAVGAADLAAASPESPVWLALTGRARPGALSPVAVREGACVDIATGAPLPDGADAVVMVERTHRDGDRVQFTRPTAREQSRREPTTCGLVSWCCEPAMCSRRHASASRPRSACGASWFGASRSSP